MDIDIPQYKKKKSKKTIKKCKHKHKYLPCLIYKWKNIMKAERCSICGKINNVHLFETEPYKTHFNKMLSQPEVLEKYIDFTIYDNETGNEINRELLDDYINKKEGH